jgi:hypothetical protein
MRSKALARYFCRPPFVPIRSGSRCLANGRNPFVPLSLQPSASLFCSVPHRKATGVFFLDYLALKKEKKRKLKVTPARKLVQA